MPRGVYPRTKEHLRLLDYARSQNKYTEYSERMKINNPMNIQRVREKHKNSMNLRDVKDKISENNSMKHKEISKKSSNTRKERYKNGSLKHNCWGRILSTITKNKIKEARAKQILPLKDTSIEIKIQNFLKQLGISFFTHQYIKEIKHGYQCDILIPSMDLVIECDGNYWHNYPIGKDIDSIRTKELIVEGFKVLRLWEFEIKDMNLNKFKEKLANVENNPSVQIEQGLSMKQEAITSTGVRL